MRLVTITDNFCDWNPTEGRPTLIGDAWHSEAEWSVGPQLTLGPRGGIEDAERTDDTDGDP